MKLIAALLHLKVTLLVEKISQAQYQLVIVGTGVGIDELTRELEIIKCKRGLVLKGRTIMESLINMTVTKNNVTCM